MSDARFQRRYDSMRELIDQRLRLVVPHNMPRDLSEGSLYVLTAPGKRVRSTLLLLSCQAVGGSIKDALGAATAIEMLHNFTLVHDDVMDNAPSRRGRATVHIKWNLSNAILVGDVILGLAYRSLLRSTRDSTREVAQLLTEGFIGVCEGQALDVEYEHRTKISLEDYFRMISGKTGKLISVAVELGAVIGNGTSSQVRTLRKFGAHIGRAFQIQDDLLDVIGDEKHFGKAVGGDIVERKKSFLLLKALELARRHDRALLRTLMRKDAPASRGGRQLVRDVTAIYKRSGAIEAARREIRNETTAGLRALHLLPASGARMMLQWFSEKLVQRTF